MEFLNQFLCQTTDSAQFQAALDHKASRAFVYIEKELQHLLEHYKLDLIDLKTRYSAVVRNAKLMRVRETADAMLSDKRMDSRERDEADL
jgi:hypothetical protein